MTTLTRHALTTLRDSLTDIFAKRRVSNIIELLQVPDHMRGKKWKWAMKLNHDALMRGDNQ